jgi:hypothetical protein
MTLKEIIEKCSKLDIKEKRCVSDEYYELIFYSKDINEWNRIFADIFGHPVKPAGTKPTVDDLSFTKDYGGICANQILFKKDDNKQVIIAMFWPWQDNTHSTLKLFLFKK